MKPQYDLNWIYFLREEIQPPFVIGRDNRDTLFRKACHRLLTQPFLKGLAVIVTSVPAFSQQEWDTFYDELIPHRRKDSRVDSWISVSQLLRHYLGQVQPLLECEAEQTLSQLQEWLERQDAINQFAMMACLYYFAQTNRKARMIFHFLLRDWDFQTQQVERLLRFYQGLTDRQKEVAALTADGLTNQEIADALVIDASGVAEHLTAVFRKFEPLIPEDASKSSARYRLIHSLTYLFLQHPYLRS